MPSTVTKATKIAKIQVGFFVCLILGKQYLEIVIDSLCSLKTKRQVHDKYQKDQDFAEV